MYKTDQNHTIKQIEMFSPEDVQGVDQHKLILCYKMWNEQVTAVERDLPLKALLLVSSPHDIQHKWKKHF